MFAYFRVVCLISIGMYALSCTDSSSSQAAQDDQVFVEIDAKHSGVDFVNTVENREDLNIFKYRNFYNGGGVAIGDINNDGLPDLYFTANMGSNKLYLNEGDMRFVDITDQAGVGLADMWSTGVVMVDIDADGLLDIYVCNAGYVKGKDQRNKLFRNNGDLTFTEIASEVGLDDNGYTTHAAFFDYDKDGDLDVYVLNNSFIPTNTLNYRNKRDLPAEEWPVQEFLRGGGDHFYRNDGGHFVDVSKEVGIYQSLIGFGLGVTVGDVNMDGYEDLYISNDFFERDYLYINDKRGGFKESLEDYFAHISHSSMGADMRDVNNDGLPDIFVTDMLPHDEYRLKTTASFDDINLRRLKVESGFYNQFMHNTLQLNTGVEGFKDICFQSGVSATDWSWGALMFDADNDGWTDLFVCNGVYHDVIDLDFMDFFASDVIRKMALTGEREEMTNVVNEMPSVPLENMFFRNIDGLNFEDVGKEWGFAKNTFSNGSAYGDLDNDGDYDLVVSNVNQAALVYENRTTNKALSLSLKGSSDNPFAVGAKVSVHSGDKVQYHEVNPSRGFQSSVDYKILIGSLEGDAKIDSIVVVWPDMTKQRVDDVGSPHMDVVYQTIGARRHPMDLSNISEPLFSEESIGTFLAHREDDHIDFYEEPGLYRLLSREGPASSAQDINGDGKDDIFIGGAADQHGSIYVSEGTGYRLVVPRILQEEAHYEDTYSCFVDVDADGDYDLVVGSGGNHHDPNSPEMMDRLYLNKGNLLFERGNLGVEESMNTSVIVPWDFDADGDQDLFVASRSVPKHYGFSPIHFLLENDGSGNFRDVSREKGSILDRIGMVTSAVSVDVDGDGVLELVTVGDWEAPKVFDFKNDRLVELESGLEDRRGWYSSVATGDLDGDGDQDLIFGNLGLNTYLESRSAGTWRLRINDFDNNGFVDKVLSYDIGGQDIPMAQKRDLANQITSIKKRNIRHHDYARSVMSDLFDQQTLDQCRVLTATDRRSYVGLNNGQGRFEVVELPDEAQLSSIKAILLYDVDGDEDLDIIIGGNDFGFLPQMSRLDASYGAVLRNNGQGVFEFWPERESGLMVKGEVKNILMLENGSILFVRNNAIPAMYGRNDLQKIEN